MPLVAGTVSIDPDTAEVSGTGAALALYQAEAAATPVAGWLTDDAADLVESLNPGEYTPEQIAQAVVFIAEQRQKVATKCEAQAEALVALIGSGVVIVPPGGGGGTFPVV